MQSRWRASRSERSWRTPENGVDDDDVKAPFLTAATVRYLFASTWAPRDAGSDTIHVPGALVNGADTVANLVNVAIWNLCEHGRVQVEQLRPLRVERTGVMGGSSFARLTVLDENTNLPGIEGALLRAARKRDQKSNWLVEKASGLVDQLSGDDPCGIRHLVLAIRGDTGSPSWYVASYCLNEARAAGLLELEGFLIRKPRITDQAAVDALRPLDEQVSALRKAYRERNEDLDNAVLSDCLHAMRWPVSRS